MAEDAFAQTDLTAMTTELVAAYVAKNSVPVGELPNLIRSVHQSLSGLGTPPAVEAPAAPLVPAVSIRKSVTDEYIISLEDGRKFKSLKRYLATSHGMTPAEYRAKWGLPPDYPMVAPAYAAKRSALAQVRSASAARPQPRPSPSRSPRRPRPRLRRRRRSAAGPRRRREVVILRQPIGYDGAAVGHAIRRGCRDGGGRVRSGLLQAPYVLDGLLHHGSALPIAEHYTDTGGVSDHVFALCALLGFRFCPRLRDFPDRRLVSIAAPSTYPVLLPLLGKRVRTDIIREHWSDILRLVASVQSGHAAPSAMLKKLAAYERQNRLHLALQEVGKVERTLFMLDWLGKSRPSSPVSGGAEQGRTAARPDGRDLHVPAGAHRRPHPRGPAIPRVGIEPGDRRHRVVEPDLHGRCRRPLAGHRRDGSREPPRPHIAGGMGAHRLLGRLPVGSCRRHPARPTGAEHRPKRAPGSLSKTASCSVRP